MTHEARQPIPNTSVNGGVVEANAEPQPSLTMDEYLALTEPKPTYSNLVLGRGLNFVRKRGEKTDTFFPDPPVPDENKPEMALLTDGHQAAVEKYMGRKPNGIIWSPDFYGEGDSRRVIIRVGMQYDFLDPETGKTIRLRDIEEGQREEMAKLAIALGLNTSQDQETGSGNPRSEPLPPEESL